jgi:hypothetical protein
MAGPALEGKARIAFDCVNRCQNRPTFGCLHPSFRGEAEPEMG